MRRRRAALGRKGDRGGRRDRSRRRLLGHPCGRSDQGGAAPPACVPGLRGSVADQHVAGPLPGRFRGGRLRGGRLRRGRPSDRRVRCIRRLPLPRFEWHCAPRVVVDLDQRRPDAQVLALFAVQCAHGAAERRRHFDDRFRRLHFCDGLVHDDNVADVHQPAHQRRLGQAFAEVGKPEDLRRHAPVPFPSTTSSHCSRSTASSSRSTLGR